MSLEIIEYTHKDANSESEIIATIKQRTGLELTALDYVENTSNAKYFNVRFPDMAESQKVKILTIHLSGTFFIDATNHFLCYLVASGAENYNHVEDLYRALVFDSNGKLANACFTINNLWYETMNASIISNYLFEDVYQKSDITLCPLRVFAQNSDKANVQCFVKNCYVNYERKFQKGLKFIDQNGNKFMTLGGYILYKIN